MSVLENEALWGQIASLIIRSRPGKPNQRKADSQASFANSGCFCEFGVFFFVEKQRENSQPPPPTNSRTALILVSFLCLSKEKRSEFTKTPQIRTGLRIGLSLVLFAGATPEIREPFARPFFGQFFGPSPSGGCRPLRRPFLGRFRPWARFPVCSRPTKSQSKFFQQFR